MSEANELHARAPKPTCACGEPAELQHTETKETMCRACAYTHVHAKKLAWDFLKIGVNVEADDYDCLAINEHCECGLLLNDDDMHEWLSEDWTPEKVPLCENCLSKKKETK